MSTRNKSPVYLNRSEKKILRLFVSGLPRKSIAQKLGVDTVHSDIRRMLRKIRAVYKTDGMTSTKVMMLYAFTVGLVEPLRLKSTPTAE